MGKRARPAPPGHAPALPGHLPGARHRQLHERHLWPHLRPVPRAPRPLELLLHPLPADRGEPREALWDQLPPELCAQPPEVAPLLADAAPPRPPPRGLQALQLHLLRRRRPLGLGLWLAQGRARARAPLPGHGARPQARRGGAQARGDQPVLLGQHHRRRAHRQDHRGRAQGAHGARQGVDCGGRHCLRRGQVRGQAPGRGEAHPRHGGQGRDQGLRGRGALQQGPRDPPLPAHRRPRRRPGDGPQDRRGLLLERPHRRAPPALALHLPRGPLRAPGRRVPRGLRRHGARGRDGRLPLPLLKAFSDGGGRERCLRAARCPPLAPGTGPPPPEGAPSPRVPGTGAPPPRGAPARGRWGHPTK
mmetsp:Transcript_21548/g.72525  ORF Transcript_21548/g.72525 Transcript_21548/m.72525 type:complete len:361 (+) Transcript_21548:802-1884(+)